MSRNPERNDRKQGKSFASSERGPRTGDGPKKSGPTRGSGGPGKGPGGPSGGGEGGGRGGWNPNPREKTFADSQRAPRPQRAGADSDNFLWGRHPVVAALANPARKGMGRLLATEDRAAEIEREGLALHGHKVEVMDAQMLDRMLPAGAVHQGMVFKVAALEGVALEDIAEPAEGIIVMLDQLTDPQNVGAIFRSALAFGARGIIVQDRHSPALAGALAKASAGATERLPCARVTNLSRALEQLADLGWRAVGLDGSSEETLDTALDNRPTVLVMGSEGDGIRRLVAEHCDVLAKIPMPGGFESLNVSNAAAVA
ncbi:MAG: 23S rRNA (guanosine(2251)-2'-O)-methyltransferase RlmB, partial [Caulobacteraceae bacterium]